MKNMAAELGHAIAWATKEYNHAFDKGGSPYALHALWVMNEVLQFGFDHAILGVCHDVIEDNYASNPELGFEIFAKNVTCDASIIADLRLLTHLNGESYDAYIAKIAGSERATRVKCADLRHNADITRLKGISEKDIARMKKYNASYLYLTGRSKDLLQAIISA